MVEQVSASMGGSAVVSVDARSAVVPASASTGGGAMRARSAHVFILAAQ